MEPPHDPTEERNARFLRLYRPVHADCERWALSLAGNTADAEDVLQTAVTAGLSKLAQLKEETSFRQWMFRIIHAAFLQGLRQGKRRPEPVDPATLGGMGQRGDHWTEHVDRAAAVRQLLQQLSFDQRTALWLYEVEGFSTRQIAETLGKTEVATRVTLMRARQRMAELLDKAGIQPGVLEE